MERIEQKKKVVVVPFTNRKAGTPTRSASVGKKDNSAIQKTVTKAPAETENLLSNGWPETSANATLQCKTASIAIRKHAVGFRTLAGILVNSLQPFVTVVYATSNWADTCQP